MTIDSFFLTELRSMNPKGIYKIERCPLCNGTDLKPTNSVISTPKELKEIHIALVEYNICSCGFIFHKYKYAPKDYYRSVYRNNLHGKNPTADNIFTEINQADRITSLLGDTPKSALDFGSSTGVLLRKLQEKYSCKTVGVELCDTFRKHSNGRGTNTVSTVDELPVEKYDLITCIHTLEHMYDPVELLGTLRSLLSDDGILVIEVPIGQSAYRLSHPIVFTEETLTRALRNAKYEIVKTTIIKPNNLDVIAKRM
jgi:2-polyprenyl-3-methyl-5-hydroxy-6-metoxy-1,4-benzoquinol methylase